MSDSLQPHGLQHARLPRTSSTPRACSNSCPLSRWCHATISSSVTLFSSRLQFFPASRSFPMSQFFASGPQSIGESASASVLPVNIQDWFPLGLTGWISLQPKEGYAAAAAAKSLQSCPTLRDPIDGSPPGSPVPGILQARTLEWVAISFSMHEKWKWSHSVVSDS